MLYAPHPVDVTERRPFAVDARLTDAMIATGSAPAGAQALLDGRALAVTTGQQAGLFTGPMYTIYKALTAAGLARALTARWGVPVVPIHWVAGDDHDFAEIDHCTVAAADGSAVTVRLRERAPSAKLLPAYREMLGPEVERALEMLASLLPPTDAAAEALDWLRDAYRPELSVAEAHARALAALLGPLGVVVVRGWHGGLKQAAARVFLAAGREAAVLDRRLAEHAESLRAAGYEVPVEVGGGLSLLMVEAEQGRDRLRIDGQGFVTRRSGERFGVPEIESLLSSEPERVSANVLLRPLVEAAVFPTVAYVGGPAELAYLRQADSVFEALDVMAPARVPRVSGFLIDRKADKVMSRYGLAVQDFADSEGALTSRIARLALPESARAALESLRAALRERYAAFQSEAAAIEPTLARTVETARNSALAVSHELEKKLVAALKRRGEEAIQQVARVRRVLFPNGQAQERVFTWAWARAHHGQEAFETVSEAVGVHLKLLLDGPGDGV